MIGGKIAEIMSVGGGTIVIDQEQMKLSPERMRKWYGAVVSAPEIEDIKSALQNGPIGHESSREELLATLGRDMMLYDKHGPLDLILYADNHEESRKWARKRFREMKLDRMEDRLLKWTADLRQPRLEDLLLPEELGQIAGELIECVQERTDAQRDLALVDDGTPSELAFRSVQQLLSDLAEAIRRSQPSASREPFSWKARSSGRARPKSRSYPASRFWLRTRRARNCRSSRN